MSAQTLLLNASYEPIHVLSIRRAIVLVLADKAEILEQADGEYHSAERTFPIPSVIRLKRLVKVPARRRLPLTRRNVLSRDNHVCAYCGGPALWGGPDAHRGTVDHVHPRARGGRHTWTNVVAACSPCNSRKNDHTLAELGWRLRVTPWVPKGRLWIALADLNVEPTWTAYVAHLATA
jgi:5-methylcytosine-specific restriction endonuclease McrA